MRRRGRPPYPDVLTPREWEVLALLREGLSNEEIAQRLGVSLAGAKYHVSEILGKLGVANREEAARWSPRLRPWWATALAPAVWLWRRGSSSTIATVAAAGVVVAVAAGVALLAWGLLRTSGGGTNVAVPSATTVGTPVVGTACPGGPTVPPASGPLFAYAAADDTISVAGADGAVSVQLICSATGARNAAWSASGKYLAHVVEGGKAHPNDDVSLRILNVETGQDTVVDEGASASLLSGSDPPSANLQWSPRSDILAYERFRNSDPRFPEGIWEVTPGRAPFAVIQTGVARFVWSPDGRWIVYEIYEPPADTGLTPVTSVTNHLFRVNADGGDAHKLTDGILLARPWSPDGRLLAYWKDDHGGSATIGDIYIMDVESEREFSLGQFTSDEHPQWSADASRDVFYNLAVDPATHAATPLFDRPTVILGWSPDGTKVAYVESGTSGPPARNLVVLALQTSERTTVHTSTAFVAHAGWPGYGGVWSPDSRYYAFAAVEADAGTATLYVADTRSGEKTRVLEQIVLGAVSVSYSPDGSRLLIQPGISQGPWSVWMANADGSAMTKIADGQALMGNLDLGAWRPATPQ